MSNYKDLFFKHLAQTSPSPPALEIKSAEGNYIIDNEGKKYLDLISGISVNNLGHKYPDIQKAITAQMDKYSHVMVFGEYIQDIQVEYANLIQSVLPGSLNSVYFTNSGSEATEGAIKLAKRHTGRNEVITFRNSYHGNTAGALSVVGNEELKNSFRPLVPGTKIIDYNNEDELEKITRNTACVIIELLQGEAGVVVGTNKFIKALRNKCSETSTLLIIDEVQTGYGRTGKLFAFEHYDVIPDLLLLGKAFGGGLPLAAFICDKSIMDKLTSNPALGHITTFGGNPLCCAAGKACLEVLLKENFIYEVENKEKLFRNNLVSRSIKSISGKGLLMAIHLAEGKDADKIVKRCLTEGIITDWFLFKRDAVRLAPPLTISRNEIINACEKLKKIIESS